MVVRKLYSEFEAVARAEQGVEYGCARDVQIHLGYSQWPNFEQVIEKATTTCRKSGQRVEIGSGGRREIADMALTR